VCIMHKVPCKAKATKSRAGQTGVPRERNLVNLKRATGALGLGSDLHCSSIFLSAYFGVFPIAIYPTLIHQFLGSVVFPSGSLYHNLPVSLQAPSTAQHTVVTHRFAKTTAGVLTPSHLSPDTRDKYRTSSPRVGNHGILGRSLGNTKVGVLSPRDCRSIFSFLGLVGGSAIPAGH
jgi:hypothetical protein